MGNRRDHRRDGRGKLTKQVFYAPERGDVVWISFAAQQGDGQASRRLGVVLSPQAYNSRVGLAVLCPISLHVKAYPFEVPIPPGLAVEGVILADQVQSLDWRARRAEHVCSLPAAIIEEALGKLGALLK
jgi:mRNA interferase MazF